MITLGKVPSLRLVGFAAELILSQQQLRLFAWCKAKIFKEFRWCFFLPYWSYLSSLSPYWDTAACSYVFFKINGAFFMML